eukprot:Skav234077  [mRNA]  locus=scaffold2565:264400:271497:+ [translate_table: standard]
MKRIPTRDSTGQMTPAGGDQVPTSVQEKLFQEPPLDVVSFEWCHANGAQAFEKLVTGCRFDAHLVVKSLQLALAVASGQAEVVSLETGHGSGSGTLLDQNDGLHGTKAGPAWPDTQEFVRHVEEGCPYRADDVMKPEQAVSTGTSLASNGFFLTLVVCEFDGGVVMCADTRTSTGQYVANRASRKISKVHDRIFICRSGSAADTQALTTFVIHYLSQHAVELGPG